MRDTVLVMATLVSENDEELLCMANDEEAIERMVELVMTLEARLSTSECI